jgi:hypothetical protein
MHLHPCVDYSAIWAAVSFLPSYPSCSCKKQICMKPRGTYLPLGEEVTLRGAGKCGRGRPTSMRAQHQDWSKRQAKPPLLSFLFLLSVDWRIPTLIIKVAPRRDKVKFSLRSLPSTPSSRKMTRNLGSRRNEAKAMMIQMGIVYVVFAALLAICTPIVAGPAYSTMMTGCAAGCLTFSVQVHSPIAHSHPTLHPA